MSSMRRALIRARHGRRLQYFHGSRHAWRTNRRCMGVPVWRAFGPVFVTPQSDVNSRAWCRKTKQLHEIRHFTFVRSTCLLAVYCTAHVAYSTAHVVSRARPKIRYDHFVISLHARIWCPDASRTKCVGTDDGSVQLIIEGLMRCCCVVPRLSTRKTSNCRRAGKVTMLCWLGF